MAPVSFLGERGPAPLRTPRRRREHPHIVLADGFAAVSPFLMPRRRRQHPHIVLAEGFAGIPPFFVPRRQREHPHIVLADQNTADEKWTIPATDSFPFLSLLLNRRPTPPHRQKAIQGISPSDPTPSGNRRPTPTPSRGLSRARHRQLTPSHGTTLQNR